MARNAKLTRPRGAAKRRVGDLPPKTKCVVPGIGKVMVVLKQGTASTYVRMPVERDIFGFELDGPRGARIWKETHKHVKGSECVHISKGTVVEVLS